MIVSFAWTTPALLAGAKTVTRRDWTPQHAAHFHRGDVVDAWSKSPRAHGEKVARILITRDPWVQMSNAVKPDDWTREGFEWFAWNGTPEDRLRVDAIWMGWRTTPRPLYVVEFELVEVLPS